MNRSVVNPPSIKAKTVKARKEQVERWFNKAFQELARKRSIKPQRLPPRRLLVKGLLDAEVRQAPLRRASGLLNLKTN